MSNYEVGYRKPPKAHRFKPGQSGNPAGPKRKAKPFIDTSEAAILSRLDEEPIELSGTMMSKREAELRVYQLKSLKGDIRAALFLDRKRAAAGIDKPQSLGVLVVPARPDDWEARAARQQAQFREKPYLDSEKA